ncbi:MAG: 16S rRNA (uracil(1498)-N(3))-methyltransferase [Myxococcales bacterium]|nr:16S rRNA (uracil(1498)-N(3))-methyltransferase [Myxococcales bacterium]
MSIRIFVEPADLAAGALEIRGEEHHYLSKVRRQAVGALVCLLDGQGRMADAQIVEISDGATSLQVLEPQNVLPPKFSLCVVPALIKGERMNLAITKMVELGVQRISPVTTERTVVRLKGDRAQSRVARFQSLSRAASRQSRNPSPPQIDPIQSLESLLARPHETGLGIIPEASGNAAPLASLLPSRAPTSATVLIGPEGGFSAAELSLANRAGFAAASLGPRVLRAETACICIASILAFRYGDIGRI